VGPLSKKIKEKYILESKIQAREKGSKSQEAKESK